MDEEMNRYILQCSEWERSHLKSGLSNVTSEWDSEDLYITTQMYDRTSDAFVLPAVVCRTHTQKVSQRFCPSYKTKRVTCKKIQS
jgi:hypothetical protein